MERKRSTWYFDIKCLDLFGISPRKILPETSSRTVPTEFAVEGYTAFRLDRFVPAQPTKLGLSLPQTNHLQRARLLPSIKTKPIRSRNNTDDHLPRILKDYNCHPDGQELAVTLQVQYFESSCPTKILYGPPVLYRPLRSEIRIL